MKEKLLGAMLAMLLATPVAASGRQSPPLDVRTDTRAPVSEHMQMNDEEFSCSTGHGAGWLAVIALAGVVALRRRSPG